MRQIAHKTAGKTVPGAGRVKDDLQRIGRRREDRLFIEHQHPVFAALDDQGLRTVRQNHFRGLDQIRLPRQLAGLAVVDDHDIHQRERLFQIVPFSFDPEVHRVAGHQPGALHLAQHLLLKHRINVPEKDHLGGLIRRGKNGLEGLEHVQLGLQRMRFVELKAVFAPPPECFPIEGLKPGQVNLPRLKKPEMLLRKIPADHGNQLDFRKITGGRREIGGRAAQDVPGFAERRFNRVQRNRSHDQQAHFLPDFFILGFR